MGALNATVNRKKGGIAGNTALGMISGATNGVSRLLYGEVFGVEAAGLASALKTPAGAMISSALLYKMRNVGF